MFFIFWNACDIKATDHAQKSVMHEVHLGDFWAWSVAFISHAFQKMKNNTYIYIQYHFYVKLLCTRYFSPSKLIYSPKAVNTWITWQPAIAFTVFKYNCSVYLQWRELQSVCKYLTVWPCFNFYISILRLGDILKQSPFQLALLVVFWFGFWGVWGVAGLETLETTFISSVIRLVLV